MLTRAELQQRNEHVNVNEKETITVEGIWYQISTAALEQIQKRIPVRHISAVRLIKLVNHHRQRLGSTSTLETSKRILFTAQQFFR